jgi:cysteine-rich repeat protein
MRDGRRGREDGWWLTGIVAAVAIAWLGAPPAYAGPVSVLDFEDLPPGTVVSDQYASSYVRFSGGPQIADHAFFDPTFPHSGTKTIEPCYADEFCTAPLMATFEFAMRRVRVWVGFRGSYTSPITVALRALDATAGELGRDEVVLPPTDVGTPVQIPLEVIADGILAVEVSAGGYDNGGLAVDDFEAELGDPACGNGIVEPSEACDPAAAVNRCPTDTPSCVACVCLPRCGNGLVDAGEQCDDGNPLSGTDCCDANCMARLAGRPCGDPSESACDAPDRCDGQGSCSSQREPTGVPCRVRGSLGECDIGDACDGASPECPLGGADAGCTATMPDQTDGKNIPVTCEAPGDTLQGGPSRCEAVGFAEAPGAGVAVARTLASQEGLVQVTRTKRGRLRKGRGADPRRRRLKLELNRTGREFLQTNGSLPVLVRVTVTHGRSVRTLERIVTVLRKR